MDKAIDFDVIFAVGVFHASVLFWAYHLGSKAQGMAKLLWRSFGAAWLPQLVMRMTDLSIVGSFAGSMLLLGIYIFTIAFYILLLTSFQAVKTYTRRR